MPPRLAIGAMLAPRGADVTFDRPQRPEKSERSTPEPPALAVLLHGLTSNYTSVVDGVSKPGTIACAHCLPMLASSPVDMAVPPGPHQSDRNGRINSFVVYEHTAGMPP